jgi:hypothetical protein
MNKSIISSTVVLQGMPAIEEIQDDLIESVIPEQETGQPKSKSFGINDLWKIHRSKRYANVYPRR